MDYWVESYVDFKDLGQAASTFLAHHRNGVCVTWKMIAYPALTILQPLLDSQLIESAIKVR